MSVDYPPRLTIDRGRVLRLFTGDTFYSSSDAALREAILNAIDAVARQRDTTPALVAAMCVGFDRKNCLLSISDNGVGMTKQDLSDLFSRVGASASRLYSTDPGHRQKMIGEFGIGVMSYFLVCETFDVHTMTEGGEAISLEFSTAMIDDEIPAVLKTPERAERGTTIVLHIRDAPTLEGLIQRYPHWARNVDGLTASVVDHGVELAQGGMSHDVLPVDVDLPDWVLKCTLGPPTDFTAWRTFDGQAHVDVLYSGVFVERIEVERLWGLEGSVFVDPKRFRPKLNREGFVGTGLKVELQPFLQQIHPAALERAADLVEDALADSQSGAQWTINRLASLWLAVPRGAPYDKAASAWDAHFRSKALLRQLLKNGEERNVSVDDLVGAKYKEIYVVPTNWSNHGQMERAAVRLLRDEGKPVLVGVERDSSYLAHATYAYGSTETIVMSHFAGQLPPLVQVFSIRDQILRQESIVDVCVRPITVRVVNVGPEASGMVVVGSEIWINAATEAGRSIAHHLCDHPYGLSSLISACMTFAPDQIQAVATLCRGLQEQSFSVGPVRRQLIRIRVP